MNEVKMLRRIMVFLTLVCLTAAPCAVGQETNPPEVSDAELRAIGDTLARLNEAIKSGDATAISGCFDIEALFDEASTLGIIPQSKLDSKPELLGAMRSEIGGFMSQQAELLAWDHSEIRSVQRIAHDRIVVITRQNDALDLVTQRQYFLIERGDEWLVYDMANLGTAMRTSAGLALGMAEGEPDWASDVILMMDAASLMLNEHPAGALGVLSELANSEFPPPFEAIRLMLVASAQLELQQYGEAITSLDRATELSSDSMPILQYLRAGSYYGLGRYEAAIASAEAYRNVVGEDADVWSVIGMAHEGLGDTPAAISAYRSGLNENPNVVDNLVSLGLIIEESDVFELGEHFKQMRSPTDHFEPIVMEWLGLRNDAVLALARALREVSPNHPDADYAEAHVLLEEGEVERAARLLERAIPRVDDPDDRWWFISDYVDLMLELDRPVEAYRAIPDKSEALDAICTELELVDDATSLRAVAAEHATQWPDDPASHLWAATADFMQNKHRAALNRLAPHDARLRTEDHAYQLEFIRVGCLIALGRFEEAMVEAKRSTARDGDPWYEAVVAVAADQPDVAIPLLEACIEEHGYEYEAIMADELMLERISGDEYRAFRNKFGG